MYAPALDPPSRAELLALTPTDTIRPRPRPYIGDSVHATMSALHEDDRESVRHLYGFLHRVYAAVGRGIEERRDAAGALRRELQAADYQGVVQKIAGLGAALVAQSTPVELRKVYHDLRGGSLPALLMHLDMVESGDAMAQDIERVFILTRDHLKIMRNALPDLDPEGYERDLQPIAHTAGLLVEKWAETAYRLRGDAVQIHLECDFEGAVSECCMEFAALDRVIYNLINNASRFTVDGQVHVAVLPLDGGLDTNLRFAVANRITPEHRERVLTDMGGNVSKVFEGGYTTGGHGVGLRICGDFITHGYGLGSLREALRGGYLGAAIVRDHFVSWFHWPARRIARAA